MSHNTKEIRHAYKSKYNLKRGNQVILLMITDGEKWHYLTLKILSVLLIGITLKHKGDFYSLNCFRSYTTKNRLQKHKNVCENHDYCYNKMSQKDNKILKYNHGERSMKALICADLECLLSTCHYEPEKSSTTKINKHISSGYSLFTCSSFDAKEYNLDYYGAEGLKQFCEDLKEHVKRIINYEKKEMIS